VIACRWRDGVEHEIHVSFHVITSSKKPAEFTCGMNSEIVGSKLISENPG